MRALLPVEEVDVIIPVKPMRCLRCQQPLQGEDPQPQRHQVTEIPPEILLTDRRFWFVCYRNPRVNDCGPAGVYYCEPLQLPNPHDRLLRARDHLINDASSKLAIEKPTAVALFDPQLCKISRLYIEEK